MKAVVDALGLKRVVLVGHSMGGPVILEAARLMPEKVAALVPIDTLGRVGEKTSPEEKRAFLDPMRADFAAATRKFVRDFMFTPKSDPALAERIAQDMAAAPKEVALSALENLADYDEAAALAAIKAPLRLINTDRWPTDLAAARKYKPDVQLAVMPGLGHFPMLEDPAEFNRLLERALKDLRRSLKARCRHPGRSSPARKSSKPRPGWSPTSCWRSSRGLAEAPSFDLEGAEPLRASFVEGPPEQPTPLGPLLERLRPAIAKSYNTAGPGYLAYIPGGGVYAAALADFVACAVNRYMGVRAGGARPRPDRGDLARVAVPAHGPSRRGARHPDVGRLALQPLGRGHGTPRAARRGVPGRRPLLLRRDALLRRRRPRASPAFRARSLRALPTDARYRLQPAALAAAIREDRARGRRPFMVVANVGTTNTGAIDPLPEVLDVAREHGLWVHADAAYGGFFRLARTRRCAARRASSECDSITLDPHKGLFLPYGLGALLVRDGNALARVHREGASYVQDVTPRGLAGLRRPVSRALARLPRAAPVAAADAARPGRLPRAARREARARALGVPGARERPAFRARRRAAALGRRVSAARAGAKTRTGSARSCCAA